MRILLHIVNFIYLHTLMIPQLAENPDVLQASLNEMEKYCVIFDLYVNINKTKSYFFPRENYENTIYLTSVNTVPDTMVEYNYLGLVFKCNAKLNIAKSHLCQKGFRAMFSF